MKRRCGKHCGKIVRKPFLIIRRYFTLIWKIDASPLHTKLLILKGSRFIRWWKETLGEVSSICGWYAPLSLSYDVYTAGSDAEYLVFPHLFLLDRSSRHEMEFNGLANFFYFFVLWTFLHNRVYNLVPSIVLKTSEVINVT